MKETAGILASVAWIFYLFIPLLLVSLVNAENKTELREFMSGKVLRVGVFHVSKYFILIELN